MLTKDLHTLKRARIRRLQAQLVLDIDRSLGHPTPPRVCDIAQGVPVPETAPETLLELKRARIRHLQSELLGKLDTMLD